MSSISFQDELRELKVVLSTLLREKEELFKQIREAETHILKGDHISFWEPKLVELREDKHYLITTETQLREQVLMRERMVFAEKASDVRESTRDRYSMESSTSDLSDESLLKQRRTRSGTWTGDETSYKAGSISRHKYEFTLKQLQTIREEPIVKVIDIDKKYNALTATADCNQDSSGMGEMQRTLSCPAIMTHREPPAGGWRHKSDDNIVVKDFVQFSGQFNVFGVNSGDDDDDIDDNKPDDDDQPPSMDDGGIPPAPLPGAIPRVPSIQALMEEEQKPSGYLSMQGILRALGSRAIDSFRFAESLVITQNYDDEGEENNAVEQATDTPGSAIINSIESGALDGFKFAESLIITQIDVDSEDGDDIDEDEHRDEVKVPVVCLSPQTREEALAPRRKELALAPSVSNHDFTVFGVDLDDDEA